MTFYHEEAKNIPVAAETEVLVAGGGPAGVGAAIAAARSGAKVMLIEKSGYPGGVATAGMMAVWSGAEECPLMNEIMDRTTRHASLPPECNPGLSAHWLRWTVPHECQKQVLLEMLREAGVTMQFHTLAVAVIKEGNKVKGVITESKSGREAIMAQVVIDATGDGDIAAFAGAEYLLGREEDGVCQPATLMFRVGGVDYSRAVFPRAFGSFIELPKGEIQALGRKHLPFPAGHVLLYRNRLPGEVTVNMTNTIGINGTDVRDLTRAEINCRQQMDKIVQFLREFVPGYEKCYLSASAETVGIRETRHFKGVLTLTADDILKSTVFEDWIATRNWFNFDIHNTKGPGLDHNGEENSIPPTGAYSIPYRACIPEKLDGLLLSGRNISGTHKAHASYRVMGSCLNIGVGVGTAAAVAVQNNCELRDVDIRKVQKILLDGGTVV